MNKHHHHTPGDGSNDVVPTQELLTIKEAAAHLRISAWTVYRLIQRRQLATIRIGRRRLVPASAIHAFIDNLQQEDAA